jgi:hypothetical protein
MGVDLSVGLVMGISLGATPPFGLLFGFRSRTFTVVFLFAGMLVSFLIAKRPRSSEVKDGTEAGQFENRATGKPTTIFQRDMTSQGCVISVKVEKNGHQDHVTRVNHATFR